MATITTRGDIIYYSYGFSFPPEQLCADLTMQLGISIKSPANASSAMSLELSDPEQREGLLGKTLLTLGSVPTSALRNPDSVEDVSLGDLFILCD